MKVKKSGAIAPLEAEEGVFFGAGYATAQDRWFQMELSRRYVQGRLAEILGERWLESDKLMRTLGLYRHAQAVVPHLSSDTRRALEAYAAGVNEYTRQHKGKLLYLFDRYDIQPEAWTPADCVAAWKKKVRAPFAVPPATAPRRAGRWCAATRETSLRRAASAANGTPRRKSPPPNLPPRSLRGR